MPSRTLRQGGLVAPTDGTTALATGVARPAQRPITDGHSYLQILKSSALIGGSSVLNIALGIVRLKAMAVMLGPAGVGLMGAFASIADMTRSVAELGINRSGVRQIAEAVASEDRVRIARTVLVLRRVAVALGLLGAILLVAFAVPVATISFGADDHAGSVMLLSAAVFFSLIAGGQGALIQGTRRIGDLAKMGVWGGLLGTGVSIPIVFYLGEDGVVPSLVAVAATSALMSWWYSRKVKVAAAPMTAYEVAHETAALLKLGIAFMASGLLMMGAAYAVRIIVLRQLGLDAAGLYQSAWTLGGLYVGFILQAMGTDFYPRLVGVVHRHADCNQLVNQQAHVSLLLAGPGVLATLIFAPLALSLLYTSEFAAAVDVLRWFCLGMALRVITWPMGFIIVAKNKQALFFAAELAWTIVNVGLSWYCVQAFGLDGTGIAFFGSYVFHWLMIYPIVRRLTGFRWSRQSLQSAAVFLLLIALVFGGFYILPAFWATAFGTLVLLASGLHSMRTLARLVTADHLPRSVRRVLTVLRLAPSGAAQ